jgi:lipoprotein-anchoring transpeptidase ErfK/SrfK
LNQQKSTRKKSKKMNRLALALASSALALSIPLAPALASVETVEAKSAALEAADQARADMANVFGGKLLKPGQYVWRDGVTEGAPRVVISLSDQMAYLYRDEQLVAVSTISSGTDEHPTPTGIFPILAKQTMYRSKKYDDAPMPFMQRLDSYGIAMHAGHLPGHPASHGCIRLPAKFAARLYRLTELGSTVLIAA